ncbi:MAG: HEAT repeat domain-containing protein [Planctomycetota bacterium]
MAALLGLGGLTACSSTEVRDGGSQRGSRVVGARIAFSDAPELVEVAQLEYDRSTGGGRLQELASSGEVEVRRRATVALGRLPYPEFGDEVTRALVDRLEDGDVYVRRAAVFALGQRQAPETGALLAAYLNDADPELRVRVVESSRTLDHDGLRSAVALTLRDQRLEVRIAAVLAMALWDTEAPNAKEVDRLLLDLLLPAGSPGTEVDAELRWRTLYALQRRKADLGRAAFLVFARSEVPLERLYAVRGLAAIEPGERSLAALVEATEDPDWRVAAEALIGLAAHPSPDTMAAVLKACEHSSVHVRRRAFEALGSFEDAQRLVPKLTRGARDVSPSVQSAAIASLAKVLPSDDALDYIKGYAVDEDPVLRSGVAEAAAELDAADAVPLLRKLATDGHPRVAGAALSSLAKHPSPKVRELLHAALAQADNGLRLAAVLALAEMPDPSDVAPVAKALATSTGDIATEVAFSALRTLGAIGGDEAQELVRQALAHPEPHVRRVAAETLRDSFDTFPNPPAVEERAPEAAIDEAPVPGRDFPRWKRNPIVEISTTRGPMVFELLPTEAPMHVHNFLQLARQDYYDGLVFHRVVPDFVIQGGDYRGDGSGGRAWNGRTVPQEFTPRRYVRGSLGMPRNEDPDSGGSQLFVTHRATPHLDGRYTIFGELRSGGDTLDRIDVGDRILDVRVLR